jgi:hypothetical protein
MIGKKQYVLCVACNAAFQNQEDHELWLVGSLAEINEHMAGT